MLSNHRKSKGIHSKYIIMILLFGYLYNYLFYLMYHQSYNTILYSLIHVTVSSIVLYYCVVSINRSVENQKFSYTYMFLLMITIYANVASIKYVGQMYSNINLTNEQRLTASIYLLICTTILIWIVNRIQVYRKSNNYDSERLKPQRWIIWLFIVWLIYRKVITFLLNPVSSYLQSNDTSSLFSITNLIDNALMGVLFLLIILDLKKIKEIHFKGSKLKIPIYKNFIQLIIVVLIYVFYGFVNGQRSAMFIPVFGMLSGLLLTKKIKTSLLVKLLMVLPVIYLFFSSMSYIVSGRLADGTNSDILALFLSYRCDQADVVYVIAQKATHTYTLQLLKQGFLFAIPSFFGVDKSLFASGGGGAYDAIMNSAGLGTFDYADSVFSIGASFWGWIGVFVFPVIYIVLLEIADACISKNNIYGLFYKVAAFSFFLNIETAPYTLFTFIRDFISTEIIVFIVCHVIKRIGIHQRLNSKIERIE